MENATPFGIYKILFFLLTNTLGINLFAQDYYVDLEGNQHNIKIVDWNLDKVLITENGKDVELTPNKVSFIYRDVAEVKYIPIDSIVTNKKHQSFFIPSIESVKALSTDNFRDENFKVWRSGAYVLYEIQNLGMNFSKNTVKNVIPIELNDVFIYKTGIGLNKIVSNSNDEDKYKVLLSKYVDRSSLKDSIYNDYIPLKPKKFLSFFNDNVSPLTSTLFNDKDKAIYYIQTLKDQGALVVLINLNLNKIELYRNAGNEKVANNIKEKTIKDNLSYAYSFLDSNVFNFCKVYLTDANNIKAINDGVRKNIFFNKNLEIDSTIIMNEEFYLFARKGAYYETQLEDPYFNAHKKEVTSTPVVQDAMVIYDINNTQIMEPFPSYVRTTTARFLINKKVSKANEKNKKDVNVNFADLIKKISKESGIKDFDLNAFGVVYSFNKSFHVFYDKSIKKNERYNTVFQWKAKNYYSNGWKENLFHNKSN